MGMVYPVKAHQEPNKAHDTYGSQTQQSGTSQTVFGYTGEETDSNGLVNLRARYYNPTLGQFFSLDPFEGNTEQPLSLNGYAYTQANPINAVDPSGMYMIPNPKLWSGCKATLLASNSNRTVPPEIKEQILESSISISFGIPNNQSDCSRGPDGSCYGFHAGLGTWTPANQIYTHSHGYFGNLIDPSRFYINLQRGNLGLLLPNNQYNVDLSVLDLGIIKSPVLQTQGALFAKPAKLGGYLASNNTLEDFIGSAIYYVHIVGNRPSSDGVTLASSVQLDVAVATLSGYGLFSHGGVNGPTNEYIAIPDDSSQRELDGDSGSGYFLYINGVLYFVGVSEAVGQKPDGTYIQTFAGVG